MKSYEFKIEEVIYDTSPTKQSSVFLKVRDSEGVFIAFRGRGMSRLGLDKNVKNINLIKSCKLPVTVKIESEWNLEADIGCRKNIGATFDVPESLSVEIVS
jgi:hypothetical protein